MIARSVEMSLRQNREWIIIAFLILLVALLRWPTLEQPFDNDSGANAYHARLIVRGEPLYGSHHPAHHLPGIQYTYALAFFLFGDTLWSVKFLLILWTIATVYVLYRFGVLVMDWRVGLVAAMFYALLSSHILMWGSSAQTELFANLPRIMAMFILVRLLLKDSTSWQFALVGLFSAVSFLFKANYLSSLVLAALILLIKLWQTRTTSDAWRMILKQGLYLGGGFLAGLLPVIFYFGVLGLLPRLFLVFSLGLGYINRPSVTVGLLDRLWFPLLGLALNNIALLILSLSGMILIVMNWFNSRQTGQPQSALMYVVMWYLFSFLEASVARIPFLHYYLLLVPPLSLLAAWFLLTLFDTLQQHLKIGYRWVASATISLLLMITLSLSVTQNFDYYYHYTRYKLGDETYRDFLLKGWPVAGIEVLRLQQLATYIKEHTASSDRIYYWSIYLQVYYLADRRSPIDTIIPDYVTATGPYQRIFSPQTKYIVVDPELSRPDWLVAGLTKSYVLETVIQEQEIYRRVN